MISVIIPTYNRGNLIERAIKSVCNQTYPAIEIIVVDDASTDNTKSIVEGLRVPNLRYFRLNENSGACHARNVGIDNSNGEYISFLDSDDEWLPDKLNDQYLFLQNNQASVVCCNYWISNGKKKKKRISSRGKNVLKYEELLNSNIVTTGSLLLKKSVFDTVGKFDEYMPRYQDWELVLRIAKCYDIFISNNPLLILHVQADSITNSTSKEKKFYALSRMVEKNLVEMKNHPKAYSHHCWSMGLYSTYMDKIRWDLLKKSIWLDGFNFKRFVVYVLLKIGLKEVLKLQYSINH